MSSKVSLAFLFAVLVAAGHGASITRIVGGENASDAQFPHQISLRRKGAFTCGGSIISERFVLTAAHCVVQGGITPYPAKSFTIQAGSNNRLSGGVVIEVKAITVNENYGNFLNDVALLELATPLVYSIGIQPIPLAKSEVPVGSNVTISGWGRLTTGGKIPYWLQYNTLEAISRAKCAITIGMNSDSLLCLAHEVGNGACNGDSGGPALYNGELVGVAGFVVGGCGSKYPDGYAKVSYHYEWIQSKLSKKVYQI